jgi:hypothetical protein
MRLLISLLTPIKVEDVYESSDALNKWKRIP